MRSRRGHEVTVRGVTYPSHSAAARALGVSAQALHSAVSRGSLHRIGSGRCGKEPMAVRIRGVVYANAAAAAKALGVTRKAIYQALFVGDPDRVGVRKHVPSAHAKPVQIGPLSWPNRTAAARDLRCAMKTIALAATGGPSPARERLIARAMRLAAEREAGLRAARQKGWIVSESREAA